MIPVLLVILWVVLASIADIRFKAANGHFTLDFWIGLACYASTALLALWTFNRQTWGWIVLLWNCVSLGLCMLLSVVLYHEPFTTRRLIASLLLLGAILLAD